MRLFLRTSLAWILVAFVGDTLLAPMLSLGGVAPDFTVIAIVILALAEGSGAGSLGGFVVGLVQDLAHPRLLGLYALDKTLLGFAVGRLRGRIIYGMPLVEGLVVFLAALAHDTLYLLVQSRMADEAFLVPMLTNALPGALYTALIAVPLIRVADILGVLRRED
ncbi:MAG: rod shape-determining protein MreD [Candidatus Krumholzibacteriia bacterium]